ncbi:hypothetical protein Tco_0855496 [Tanacetum coccineum]
MRQMGEGMGCVGADSMGGLGGSMGGVSRSMGSLSGRPSWTDYRTMATSDVTKTTSQDKGRVQKSKSDMKIWNEKNTRNRFPQLLRFFLLGPRKSNDLYRHTQANDETPILDVQSQRHEDLEQEKTRNRFPLAVLLEVDPQNYQKVKQQPPFPMCKDHGPQTKAFYSTAKRPDFVLDTVFKPPTLFLSPPIPVPSVTTKTSAQHYEKTATNEDDKPIHVPSAIDQQPAEQSTPPIEQKTIVVRKEQTESDLPKGSARRLLIGIEEKGESTKGVKKIKYDN